MRTFTLLFLSFYLISCGGSAEQERNDPNERIFTEPAPAEIENRPAFTPSVAEKGSTAIYKGECIIFWHPNAEELAADERIVRDQDKMWMKTADEMTKAWSSKYPVYITSLDSISVIVSDSRQVTFSRLARGQDFGAVFYKVDKGPFYMDGIRSVEDVNRFLDKYFTEQ